MSSRYPIHTDWCHVSHDGPCLREDQRPPAPTAADPLTLLRNKFRCEIAPDGDYRKCGHAWHAPMFTIEETDSLLAALLAARADADRANARIAAHEAICRWLQGEEGEFPESLPGKRYNFRTVLSRRLAALATPEPR